MKLGFVLVMVLAIFARPVMAEDESANWLYENCNVNNPAADTDIKVMMGVLSCVNYMAGIVDAYQLLSGASGFMPICLPAGGMTGNQKAMVVYKYVTEHPEDLHETRRVVALLALKTYFACND